MFGRAYSIRDVNVLFLPSRFPSVQRGVDRKRAVRELRRERGRERERGERERERESKAERDN